MGRFITRKMLVTGFATVYVVAIFIAMFNFKERCRVTMPDYVTNLALLNTENAAKKCWINLNELGNVKVDIFENVDLKMVSEENPVVEQGGAWKPEGCQPWQKVAIIVPYRDRWFHLKLLMKRLHPMLRKQKIHYRIFLIEQHGKEDFSRGRLMNIGFLEALKWERFDCFVFHDVDLIPENDKNIYLCDGQARQLSSAIDEMRYHIMFYNYLGAVIAINRENFKKVNGYSNVYWGWGNEDDDLSARTLANNMLLTRPPEYIGRYKMVRHTKQSRAAHGYDQFLQWRSRMHTDGLNQFQSGEVGYKVVKITEEHLYTNISVNLGKPPEDFGVVPDAPKESFLWSTILGDESILTSAILYHVEQEGKASASLQFWRIPEIDIDANVIINSGQLD